jgi:hypothetical protein
MVDRNDLHGVLGSSILVQKGYSTERWEFWKLRFQVMKDLEDLHDETRSYAERAWYEMTRIESKKGLDME